MDSVVAMLAVQKAGAAYIPLDPSAPAGHIVRVLAESGARLLLSHAEVDRSEVAATAAGGDRTRGAGGAPARRAAGRQPRSPVAEENPMYVIYTSGSTGRPKGVVVEHRNFTNYLTGILAGWRSPTG